jgi:tetratricopeptide (TPR) repeat protein
VAIDREKVLGAAQKFAEKRRYDRAVLEYQKIIEHDPNDARTLLKIGDLQSKMAAYAEAVFTYERVGRHYAQQGFALKAIAVYKQIREIVAKHLPQHEERYAHVLPLLADLYQQLGLSTDALNTWDEIAMRYQRLGRDSEAVEVLQRVIAFDPQNPIGHLRLAEAMARGRDVEGATLEFATAARALVANGRQDDALRVLERMLHLRADPAYAKMAAELFLARGGPNDGLQALAKLQISFQANPRDLETLGLLARSFTQIQQTPKAVEVYKEMARIAKEQGRLDLVGEYVDKLVLLMPNDEGVRGLVRESGALLAARGSDASVARKSSLDEGELAPDSAIELDDDELIEEEIVLTEGSAELQIIEPELPANEASVEAPMRAPDPSITFEEREEPQSERPAEVARALQDAASLRLAHMHDKALSLLREAITAHPQALDARWGAIEILVEVGAHQQATDELLQLASLQIDRLDAAGAASTLHYVLQIDPDNARAYELFRALGYGEEGYGEEGYGEEGYGEEIEDGATELENAERLPAFAVAGDSGPNVGGADADSEALPSFPLPAESELALDLVASQGNDDEAFAERKTLLRHGGPRLDLEAALEEAEFFASRGLLQDALVLLRAKTKRFPNHPLVLEKIEEFEATAREVPEQQVAELGRESSHALSALLVDEPIAKARADEPYQVDVEEVFAKFKEGVAKHLPADDAQSHYDLGVAYQEMGLVDDALRELEIAAGSDERAVVSWSLIGEIEIGRGQIDAALAAFLRGIDETKRTREQEVMLAYEIASCYESKGDVPRAVLFLERAVAISPTFRDAGERLERLRRGEVSREAPKATLASLDDLDRMFDDLRRKS